MASEVTESADSGAEGESDQKPIKRSRTGLTIILALITATTSLGVALISREPGKSENTAPPPTTNTSPTAVSTIITTSQPLAPSSLPALATTSNSASTSSVPAIQRLSGRIDNPTNLARVSQCATAASGKVMGSQDFSYYLLIQVPHGEYYLAGRLTLDMYGNWMLPRVRVGAENDPANSVYKMLLMYANSGDSDKLDRYIPPNPSRLEPSVWKGFLGDDHILSEIEVQHASTAC